MKVIYNTSNYPYYKIKFTNSEYTEEGFNEHIKNFYNLYNLCSDNNGKMILIIDIGDLSTPPLSFIQKQVKFMKEIKLLSKEYIAETIFITSFIDKKILDIIFIYEKPVSPYIIFDNEKETIVYLKDNINRFGQILELNSNIKTITKKIDKEYNSTKESSSTEETVQKNLSPLDKLKQLISI